MITTIRIDLDWDKASGEKLPDFKRKVAAFKLHVEALQLRGHLPRVPVEWHVGRAKPAIICGPAIVVHESGSRLVL